VREPAATTVGANAAPFAVAPPASAAARWVKMLGEPALAHGAPHSRSATNSEPERWAESARSPYSTHRGDAQSWPPACRVVRAAHARGNRAHAAVVPRSAGRGPIAVRIANAPLVRGVVGNLFGDEGAAFLIGRTQPKQASFILRGRVHETRSSCLWSDAGVSHLPLRSRQLPPCFSRGCFCPIPRCARRGPFASSIPPHISAVHTRPEST
jgi:hypothetical protein